MRQLVLVLPKGTLYITTCFNEEKENTGVSFDESATNFAVRNNVKINQLKKCTPYYTRTE